MARSVESLACSYCGLPTTVTHSSTTNSVETESDVSENETASSEARPEIYCCVGCRIAAGIMFGDDESTGNRRALTRLGIAIFFTMNVMVFTLVLWTWNVHALPDNSIIHAFREVLRYACLLFSAPVMVLLGGPLVESCLDRWRERRFTTDVLLLVGVCAAFAYSVASLAFDQPDVYFEVACMILVAVTLGKWLEASAKLNATKAIRSLRQLLPETAHRIEFDTEVIVPLEEIQPSDRIRVLPGERIPVDGVVESAHVTVDEQLVTGECIPVPKPPGASVSSGTLNLDRDLVMQATTSLDESMVARLARAVEDAISTKCQITRLADRTSQWFVPLIIAASLLGFALQLSNGIQPAIMTSLAVVLIACPCALGIAAPLALWAAINVAAQNGVLFRNGDAVMALSKIRALAFDKTGTITDGKICVQCLCFDETVDVDMTKQLALLLSKSSNHPLSKAVAEHLLDPATNRKKRPIADSLVLDDAQDLPGLGVTAMLQYSATNSAIDGQSAMTKVFLGSVELARKLNFKIPDGLSTQIERYQEGAIVCIGANQRVQAVFLLDEAIQPETLVALEELRRQDLDLLILTGDRTCRAHAISQLTGVRAIGGLLPHQKSAELTKFAHPVGMVGDGINDSIALASADVGIALDSGADVSRDAASVCLLGGTIAHLPWAVRLARATQSVVRRNLVWAVSYNLVGIGFAVTGNLNPIVAAIAMVGSSLFVLANSVRLVAFAPRPDEKGPIASFQKSESDASSNPKGSLPYNQLGDAMTIGAHQMP